MKRVYGCVRYDITASDLQLMRALCGLLLCCQNASNDAPFSVRDRLCSRHLHVRFVRATCQNLISVGRTTRVCGGPQCLVPNRFSSHQELANPAFRSSLTFRSVHLAFASLPHCSLDTKSRTIVRFKSCRWHSELWSSGHSVGHTGRFGQARFSPQCQPL